MIPALRTALSLCGFAAAFLSLAAPLRSDEVYFSRSDPVENILLREINGAKVSIHLLIYSITADKLAEALVRASKRGVDVKIICDLSQSKEQHSLCDELLAQLGPKRVTIRAGKGRGIMHEKMAIYDKAVVTLGSFNWTSNARDNNWENLIVIRDAALALKCEAEFNRVWQSPEPKSS